MNATIRNLRWQSDWSGYEVGYPDVPGVDLYVNTETGDVIKILEVVE